MNQAAELTRRTLVAATLASTGAAMAQAQSAPPTGRLTFAIWRDNHNIGRHRLAFSGGGETMVVTTDAVMVVSLGPVPIFKYHHQATEIWRDGQFAALRSHTVSNGKQDQVSAIRGPGGVLVKTMAGAHALPAAAMPLTHWNPRALEGPLFNPQTGAPLREAVSRQIGQMIRVADGRPVPTTRYGLTGDADIVDWYDANGVWVALRGKAPDGSYLDYRRLA